MTLIESHPLTENWQILAKKVVSTSPIGTIESSPTSSIQAFNRAKHMANVFGLVRVSETKWQGNGRTLEIVDCEVM